MFKAADGRLTFSGVAIHCKGGGGGRVDAAKAIKRIGHISVT